jgi:DNA-binding LacI/PurR family transcriptional regulator/DNA-binding transcriptional regulator YhcF (GntR family)
VRRALDTPALSLARPRPRPLVLPAAHAAGKSDATRMASRMHTKVPRIVELADLIAADIRRRKLAPGDSYQSTLETAEMLGVSTTAANRAMQVLVKRRILERRQKKGTFVAHPPKDAPLSPLARVHLLVQEDYLRTEGVTSDGIVIGLHGELPAAQMQFNFLPPDKQGDYIEGLLAEAMRSGQTEGFVLIRASLQAQRLIAASGLPAVVNGSLHPSVPRMCWIDRDHRQGGQLLAQRLIDAGFRRIVVLMRDRMFSGDHALLDAVRDTMAQAGLGLDALTVRCLPADRDAIADAVGELLPDTGSARTGFICRSEPLAAGAALAARERRLRADADVGIVLSDVYRKPSDPPPEWPYLIATMSPEQIGQQVGTMLAQQAIGKPVEPDHLIIPVRLSEPSAPRA